MPSVINKRMLDDIKGAFESSPYAFLSSYEGLTVAEISELRRNLEKVSNRSIVVKHKLAKKVFENLKIVDYDKMFKGHILLTVGDKEPQIISKTLVDFSKSKKAFIPQGVLFEKALHDASYVKSLAALPTRMELLTQMVVRIKSPITGVVLTLNQVIKGLAVALGEIKKQKESSPAAA